MNSDAIGALIYAIVAIVVAIISATAMRVKAYNLDRFDIGDAFLGMLLGILWPLTIVASVVYLASDFLCRKIKAKEEN